jgi:hypothetical protein
MPQTVLETVLDQLGLTPREYFDRLTQSLDDIRQVRLHRVSSSRDTDLLIQEETTPTEFSGILTGETPEGFGFAEATDEEAPAVFGAAPAPAGRATRAKRTTRARTVRPAETEETELSEFGLEPLEDDDSQFRQAYRRALRTNRRPFRER